MALFQLTAVLFAVLLGAREGNSRSSGAPASACSTITPGHGVFSGTLPGGYYLYSDLIDSGGAYTSGTVYTIRLEGSNQFKGFLIQARSSGTTTPIGSFNTPSGTEHLSCSGVATATVTHSSSALKSSVTFQWTAPSGTGTVKFQYAVVQAYFNYYANIDSSVFRPPVPPPSTTLVPPSSTLAPPPPPSTTLVPLPPSVPPSSSTMAVGSSTIVPAAASSANTVFTTTSVVETIPSSTMPTTPMETPIAPPAPICPTTDKTASSNFPLTFEQPAGCSRQSCDIYVAMAPNTMNSSYLDIYMEGTAAGWVAVGFSGSRAMENTDVIGCRVDSGSTVSVVDTWNPSPNYSPNQLDDTQDGVCTHSASFTSGRISCLSSRYGTAIDTGRDLDWNTDRYIIIGRRTNTNSGQSLRQHSETPIRSTVLYNAFTHGSSPTTPTDMTPVMTAPPSTFGCPVTDKNGQMPFSNFTFGTPSGCSRTSCDVYVTMAPNTMNSSYLDIYMEGTAAGWVAVGFSNSRAMENTDVIGCRVDSGSTVSVVDTWNPSPNYTPNQVDDTQDGVCTHSTSFNNGRIQCLFSRYGPVIDSGRDLDLNRSLFILYGRRTTGNNGEMNLQKHSSMPARTPERVSPFNVTGEAPVVSDYPDKALLQIHGILMLISWPILATFAIFFASWMKPALPNGEWFQTHRALLVISLFVTVAGFIFAFVALAMNETPGLISFNTTSQRVHFAFGIIVVLFQIINPIIAIFRCKPKSSNRWIFDLAHASFVGVVAEVLALTNVGIGLSLFSQRYSPSTSFISLWTFLGYIGLLVILEVVMHVVFIVSAMMAAPEDREKLMPTMLQWCFSSKSEKYQTAEFELEEKGKESKTPDQNEKKERKPASKDAPLRWVGVGVLVFITVLVVAVIVMVVIG